MFNREVNNVKVLNLFGLGNTATLLTVGLRRLGVDCDMLVSNRHFKTQYPDWTASYPELEGHAYIWDKSDTIDPRTVVDLLKFCNQYDFVIAQPPAPIYAWMFRTKYAVWDGGSGNFILNTKWQAPQLASRINYETARRGYKNADYIFFNDINVIHQCAKHIKWMPEYGYMPLPVDTDVFVPMGEILEDRVFKDDRFFVYLPTRQEIYWKAIDQILEGFKMFLQDVPDAQLLITKYGSDVPVVDHLINVMEIEDNVHWVPLVPKPRFAELINSVDVVIDQIKLGAIGGVTVQAMSCGQKVIVNARQDWYREALGESPPVVNAKNSSGVYRGLLDVYQGRYNGLGESAKDYIKKHFDYGKIAERVKEKIEQII